MQRRTAPTVKREGRETDPFTTVWPDANTVCVLKYANMKIHSLAFSGRQRALIVKYFICLGGQPIDTIVCTVKNHQVFHLHLEGVVMR